MKPCSLTILAIRDFKSSEEQKVNLGRCLNKVLGLTAVLLASCVDLAKSLLIIYSNLII